MSINVSASLIGCPLWTTVNFKWYSLADSGGLHSHFHSGKVQSSRVRRTPPDPLSLDSTPIFTLEESSPAQSSGHPSLDSTPIFTLEESSPAQSSGLHRTPLSGLQSTFTPVDSSGVQRTHYVTICDTSGVQMSPDESGGVRQDTWGSVKYWASWTCTTRL